MTRMLGPQNQTLIDTVFALLEDEGVPAEEAISSLVQVILDQALLTGDPEQALDEVANLISSPLARE